MHTCAVWMSRTVKKKAVASVPVSGLNILLLENRYW